MCSGCSTGSGNGRYASSRSQSSAQGYNLGSSASYRNYSEGADDVKPQDHFDKFLYSRKSINEN